MNAIILSSLLILFTSTITSSGQPSSWGYQFSYPIPSNADTSNNKADQVKKNILEFPPFVSAPPLVANPSQEPQQDVLFKRQDSLEDKLNLLNARIEHQESIIHNFHQTFIDQEKLVVNSASRLDQLNRIDRDQEAMKKQQDAFIQRQEALDHLLTLLLSKIQLEQERIRKYESYLESQGTTFEGSTINRLAQLDQVDRNQKEYQKQQESILKYQKNVDDKLTRLQNHIEDQERQNRDVVTNLKANLQSQEILLAKSTIRLAQLEAEEVERRKNQQQEVKKEAAQVLGSLHENSVIDEAIALNQVGATRAVPAPRTCYAARKSNPSLPSGHYWIDPDGDKIGDSPILVYCNMATGNTLIQHDSALTVASSTNCFEPGCFSKNITYEASRQQVDALIKQSSQCHQSVRYDCYSAPLEHQGVAYSWWTDGHGNPRYFWAGNDSDAQHTCQCGIDQSCINSDAKCNCDAAQHSNVTFDEGYVKSRDVLPVTQLHFGQAIEPNGFGHFALGPLECQGNVVVKGIPTSCVDVWRIGHTLSGVYIIRGYNKIVSVFCDFAKSLFDPELETFIGYVDAKSISVYFDVERNSNYSIQNRPVPFQVETMGYGKAMNLTGGIFTAPRAGKYFFVFNGVKDKSTENIKVGLSQSSNSTMVSETRIVATVIATGITASPFTLQETLELKMGDKISVVLLEGNLADASHTFSGYLLEEDLVFKAPPRQQ